MMPAGAQKRPRKTVHAHRGASAYLPEHTLPAYALAHGMGADFIEPDLVLTRDDVFVCVHDIYLEDTTNVRQLFPGRCRPDGHWYAIDFTLAEIKGLSVHERSEDGVVAVFPGRFPLGRSRFEVATFREMIELVQGLNKSRKRSVGIIPELKHPLFHQKEGHPMEEEFLALVKEYGYDQDCARICIQCFEVETLKKLRRLGCRMPLMQLVEEPGEKYADGAPFMAELTPESLKEISLYADVVAPNKSRIEKKPEIVAWAHRAGIQVCPYTFRADSLPEKYRFFEEELYQFFYVYEVDALFTDFPDRVVKMVNYFEK